MFYWQAKTSAKTPQIHNLWGVKTDFIYPKNGMDKNLPKNVRWSPLNTEMAKKVTLDLANLKFKL